MTCYLSRIGPKQSGGLSLTTHLHLQVPPKIVDKYVNLLVVGESGLGKTTFIRNCFADLLNEDFDLLDASWGSMTEFKDSPSVFCTHLPAIEVPEALIRLRYSVQDVPGYAGALLTCACADICTVIQMLS